ncbi:MAG: ChaN family lipoprotein [Planctomycetota bacterium]
MRRVLPTALLAAALFACASPGERKDGGEAAAPAGPPPLVDPAPPGTIHRTSRPTDFAAMVEELVKADVVYVGETHDDRAHHELQLQVLQALAERGRLHGIGMEMFQRPFQAALDAYVEHRIEEEELLERTEWRKRWGFDFALYRPILEFARERRIPVIALNVPDEVRKHVREGGLAAVPEEMRARLPAVYTGDEEHRAFVREAFRGHLQEGEAFDEARFDRFYLAMCLWDDVMADSVVRWFEAAPKDAQIVVCAGGGHMANRYGVPARAFRRNGRSYAVVVPVAVKAGEPVDREVFASAYADFVVLTGGPEGK